MFGILKMLSSDPDGSSSDIQKISLDFHDEEQENNRYYNMRQQPTLLSAVEGTISSYYKDDGDELIERINRENIRIFFDDSLPITESVGYFVAEDGVIVLSSQPDDILDIAKNLYTILENR